MGWIIQIFPTLGTQQRCNSKALWVGWCAQHQRLSTLHRDINWRLQFRSPCARSLKVRCVLKLRETFPLVVLWKMYPETKSEHDLTNFSTIIPDAPAIAGPGLRNRPAGVWSTPSFPDWILNESNPPRIGLSILKNARSVGHRIRDSTAWSFMTFDIRSIVRFLFRFLSNPRGEKPLRPVVPGINEARATTKTCASNSIDYPSIGNISPIVGCLSFSYTTLTSTFSEPNMLHETCEMGRKCSPAGNMPIFWMDLFSSCRRDIITEYQVRSTWVD